MSKKFVENEIAKIKELAAAEAMGNEHHFELNSHILQALIGGEITKTKKGETKIKFSHAIPTTAQVAEIAKICDDYAQKVAERLSAAAADLILPDGEDDMDIPVENITRAIPTIDGKINNKALQSYVINPGGVMACMLSGTDCITIAAYGEAARKNAIIKRTIIIGGCVLVIAGGITAGVIIRNKKKNDEEVEDIAVIDDVEDTVPAVEIDESYTEIVDVDETADVA